jgi:SMC interacting uncharacterized protein involved in chromosome segregation
MGRVLSQKCSDIELRAEKAEAEVKSLTDDCFCVTADNTSLKSTNRLLRDKNKRYQKELEEAIKARGCHIESVANHVDKAKKEIAELQAEVDELTEIHNAQAICAEEFAATMAELKRCKYISDAWESRAKAAECDLTEFQNKG